MNNINNGSLRTLRQVSVISGIPVDTLRHAVKQTSSSLSFAASKLLDSQMWVIDTSDPNYEAYLVRHAKHKSTKYKKKEGIIERRRPKPQTKKGN